MHITARNYAAQASAHLQELAHGLRKLKTNHDALGDADRVDFVSMAIKGAVHFALPDGGKIFDDRLKGIEGKSIRPPFPLMTIEWFMPDGGREKPGQSIPVNKRIVVIEETESAGKRNVPGCYFTVVDQRLGAWHPMPVWLFLPRDEPIPNQSQFPGKQTGIMCEAGIYLPFVFREMYGADPRSAVIPDGAKRDVLTDVLCALELFEALSCSNVSHEPLHKIDPRKNARRIKAGKLPIYETRVLTIEAGKATGTGTGQSGGHASPRQHLRRGHIRRLPDKNVWVNSCVVGRPEKGIIDKQYHVK